MPSRKLNGVIYYYPFKQNSFGAFHLVSSVVCYRCEGLGLVGIGTKSTGTIIEVFPPISSYVYINFI